MIIKTPLNIIKWHDRRLIKAPPPLIFIVKKYMRISNCNSVYLCYIMWNASFESFVFHLPANYDQQFLFTCLWYSFCFDCDICIKIKTYHEFYFKNKDIQDFNLWYSHFDPPINIYELKGYGHDFWSKLFFRF